MNGSRSVLALIFIGLLCLIIIHGAAALQPFVYKVLVDDTYGFKQVRIIEPSNTTFKYENLTLVLNAGDTVIWTNDAYGPNQYYNNLDITIVSVQNLWDNSSSYLKYFGRSFNYTFNQPGTYEVYMKEYPRVRHQTIIVAAVETPTVTTPPPTQTATETATPTASVTQTPETVSAEFNLWYIMMALIVVAGIVVLWFSIKK